MASRLSGIQSVERAFAILEAMAEENREIGVTQLSDKDSCRTRLRAPERVPSLLAWLTAALFG
jgi:hypothetical protein